MTRKMIGAVVAAWLLCVAAAAQTRPVVKPATPAPASAASTVIVFQTAKGSFEITLLTATAPKSTAQIIDLVRKHFYRGLRVHRVENSLAQFGDPQTKNMTLRNYWGTAGSGKVIGVAEISKIEKHVRGTVGLAAPGDNPKMADSQIYIMKTASPSLDGRYAIIGHVTAGMAVVDSLQVNDVILDCTIKGEKK